jgi:hypothetical protein
LFERIASATILVFVFAWTICATAIAEGAESRSSASDLEGTWFVLIHYQDANTHNHKSDRWLDRVWTFKIKGSRLYWVEYPIVVFESTRGRFEAYKGNPRSRVLAKWEPNQAQLAEVMGGPRVNTRGSKSKSLRGNDARGWKSAGGNRVAGANMMGYHEDWSVSPCCNEGAPLEFAFSEIIGNSVRGSAEGRTSYLVESRSDDGQEYSGRYDRDGTRIGTFRMFRTPGIRPLHSSEEKGTVNERAFKRAAEKYKRRSK